MRDPVRQFADLHNDPYAVRTARRLVGDTLNAWRLPHLVDDAVLVSSELVTNATVHGRPPVTLTVTRDGQSVVVEVTDASRDLPLMQIPGESGHFGMWLADELALLSISLKAEGKTIRALLPCPESL